MRRLGILSLTVLLGCAAPAGEMAETDGSSGTGSSDESSGTMSSTTSPTTTMTTDPSTSASTSPPTTTVDPDSSTSIDPAGSSTDPTTGECPAGELDCPCDIGSTCTGELLCEDGTCVAEPACDQPEGEPNDDEPSAVELPEVGCGGDAMNIDGALDGAESDWFSYHAACLITFDEPDVVVTADVDLAVCVFPVCDNGGTQFNCLGAAVDDVSPEGVDGCCGQNDVIVSNFGCGIASPSGTMLVRVTSIEAMCVPYQLAFAY